MSFWRRIFGATAAEPVAIVPSKATYAQLDEALRSGADPLLGDLFYIGVGSARVPYNYPVLMRCVTLCAAVIAQLVTGGGLSVVDKRTGSRVATPARSRELRALDLFLDTPDGHQAPYPWVEATAADMLTSSSCLVRLERANGGLVQRMHRQSLSGATINAGSTPLRPVIRSCDWGSMEYRDLASYDFVHSYWGSLRSLGGSGNSDIVDTYFPIPVLRLLRPAISVGQEGEQYVRDWFQGGAAQAPFVLTFKREIQKDTRRELYEFLRSAKGRTPLPLGGDPMVTPLQGRPQNQDTAALRTMQFEEIARVYGLPPPLIGMQVTSWGAGIAELGRFGWRFGIRQHLDRYLAGFARMLLSPGQAFRVDPTDLVRGDPASLGGFIGMALGGPNNPGIISVKEARGMAGFPADIDGDIVSSSAEGGDS